MCSITSFQFESNKFFNAHSNLIVLYLPPLCFSLHLYYFFFRYISWNFRFVDIQSYASIPSTDIKFPKRDRSSAMNFCGHSWCVARTRWERTWKSRIRLNSSKLQIVFRKIWTQFLCFVKRLFQINEQHRLHVSWILQRLSLKSECSKVEIKSQ